jgi:hypothetical protein
MKNLRDAAVNAAWIAGLLLAGWLLWFFSGSLRDEGLRRQVNAVLSGRGEQFSLGEARRGRLRRIPLGTEFGLEGGEVRSFLVFPLVSGGGALSCGALIDARGRVERIVPLGAHGEQAFERISKGILDAYIRRIEGGL